MCLLFMRRVLFQVPKLTDIGCRKIFSEEHDMFRETCRRFFVDEVLPRNDELDPET